MPPTPRPHIGVLLPTREQAMLGALDAGALVEFATEAELLGFDSLWVGDSLVARPRLDPLIVLSAVAAATHRIALGTAALTPALRHPLIGANMITSLDHMAGGRLSLALGSGFPIPETEREFAAVGASYTGRAGRLDEIVELWRRTWRSGEPGAPNDFEGRYLSAEDLDRLCPPVREDGPPLWLAGSDTPAVLRRVAGKYDGWMPFLPSVPAYGRAWRQIEELREEAGRPQGAITPALYATINVNPDGTAAKNELEHYVQGYYKNTLAGMAEIQAYGWGSAERCADWLGGYVRSGARHIIIRIGSMAPEKQLKEVAETVLPALRGA
ncbi:LLM class flavin-dependent oxidoreductase [Streptomyces sp. NPDC050516]|uniref:LLM class flavin-dependent oxidoreductase n=1 Tax=Streptomyces sp. NPDC050516 TaxID=3365621 RepID=UPI0037BB45C0